MRIITLTVTILVTSVLLNCANSHKLNEDKAIQIAEQIVRKNEDWADSAKYEAMKNGNKWSVTAWRIVGYDDSGSPLFVPGGYRLIIINQDGDVENYYIGQ